jgi:ubiquinone/menaquinone biosynthesis C-methylase UbiE
VLTTAFDALAPSFDRDRALPQGVAEAIRDAVRDVAGTGRMLDLGAGTGRIGWPFVAAGDDYVGVDLSFGMLREFGRRAGAPRLVQADGHRLPFRDATFDVVMLVQVFGGMSDWRQFAGEARRVLRASGTVVVGRTARPDNGVDAGMKKKLAAILGELGVPFAKNNRREDVQRLIGEDACRDEPRTVASWTAKRTPRQFLDRHRTGARFAALPSSVKGEALHRLADWAASAFGSLDAARSESCSFELRIFAFAGAHA